MTGSTLPWSQVEPRSWEWRSDDGLTLLRIKRVGMECERSHYVYKNGKLLGCRRDVDEAKVLAESGESEVPDPRSIPAEDYRGPDGLALPESLRLTPQQRAAERAKAPARPFLDPKLSAAPKTPAAQLKAQFEIEGRGARDLPPPVTHVNRPAGKTKITGGATIVAQDKNPRKPGSAGHEHYERMRGGITVAAYIARHKSEKDKKTARQWLSNTIRDGFVALKS